MQFTRLACLLAVTLLASAACGSDDTDEEGPTATTAAAADPAADLAGTTWKLAGWSAEGTMEAPAEAATLTFGTDGALTGTTGCNNFGGTWEGGEGDLSITLGPITLAGCLAPQVGDQEQSILAGLEATTSYDGGGESLTLADSDGQALLEYDAVSDDLGGTSWQATGINNGTGGVESNANTPLVTIDFADGGTATGFAACNNYDATWSTDGDGISIGVDSITEMSCGADLDALEAQYVAALGAATTYTVTGSALELRDDGGALQVSYAPAG